MTTSIDFCPTSLNGWGKQHTYYPLPSVPRVSCFVQVEDGQRAIEVRGVECDCCAALLQSSDLLGMVKAFIWNVIEELDINMIDRRLHGLA